MASAVALLFKPDDNGLVLGEALADEHPALVEGRCVCGSAARAEGARIVVGTPMSVTIGIGVARNGVHLNLRITVVAVSPAEDENGGSMRARDLPEEFHEEQIGNESAAIAEVEHVAGGIVVNASGHPMLVHDKGPHGSVRLRCEDGCGAQGDQQI